MKKIIILTILITILLLSACTNQTKVKNPYEDPKLDLTKYEGSILIETDSVKLADRTADCTLLNAEDIGDVCNINVEVVEGPLEGDIVCSKIFKINNEQALSFTYVDLGGTTPQQMTHCIETLHGEALGEHSCFAVNADNTAYVHGKRYTLTLKNMAEVDENTICSENELKALSRIIESRIYN